MKLRLHWLVAMVALCSSVNFSPAQSTSRPNVIIIMADDFGFECVAANGGQSYKTPNLDRLAATGMRFENCHVQPLCTPTRLQLMTGQYNVRNYAKFGFVDPKSTTFAHLFRDNGYTTAIAGKWQLGKDVSLPKRLGFDEYYLWQLTHRPERYRNPGLEINGVELNYTKGEYGPDIINDHALEFITRNQKKPFLLYYPMILTHDPFVPTPDSPDYDDDSVPRTGRDSKYFAHMVAYADKLVGRITDKLDELKLRENTLVLFLGDNGTYPTVTSQFRDKPYQGGKGMRTGNGTHVPLIVNMPKTIPPGRVNQDLLDSTDIFPTICDAAGLKIPKTLRMDGKSFWAQLRGEKGSPREWSYCWYARHGFLQFEFARNLKYKLYRAGDLVEVINDQEERPLKGELSVEAKQARIKLAKVLEQYSDVRPPELKAFEFAPENARKKQNLDEEE